MSAPMTIISFPPRQPPPERGSGAPLAHPAMTFEQFADANADRIWRLLVTTDRRHCSFDQLARELWRAM
jgi:hypothetical protein